MGGGGGYLASIKPLRSTKIGWDFLKNLGPKFTQNKILVRTNKFENLFTKTIKPTETKLVLNCSKYSQIYKRML